MHTSLILPEHVLPADLAAHFGVSERTVRSKLREIGAFAQMGNKMLVFPEHVEMLKEAMTCHSGSRSAGTPDKAIAERIRAEIEIAEWKRHLDGPHAHVTFAQAALAYLEAEKSERFIAPIAAHWKDTPLREITAEAVRQSAFKLYPNAKGATRNRQVIVPTQAIINHAAGLNWCSP